MGVIAAGVADKALASAEAAGDRFAAGYALHALSGCLDPSITGPGCMGCSR